jgi:hypothetical protein
LKRKTNKFQIALKTQEILYEFTKIEPEMHKIRETHLRLSMGERSSTFRKLRTEVRGRKCHREREEAGKGERGQRRRKRARGRRVREDRLAKRVEAVTAKE